MAEPLRITINGGPLLPVHAAKIAELERTTGRSAIPGDYWYDDATGALGQWGGPTLTFLPPKLGLGGPLPAHASGGGDGRLTGVFINGRELHPLDVQSLGAALGTPILPGRWWVDAYGNAGYEGAPPLFNLWLLAQQNGRGQRGNPYYRSDGKGNSTYVGSGGAAVHGSYGSGDDKVSYSYFVGLD